MEERLNQAIISNINPLSPRVLEFSLNPKVPISFVPGQFIVIHHKGVERSYSISNKPGEGHLEIIVSLNEQGQLTPDLFEKKVGDKLSISGPKGAFVLPEEKSSGICFICTGTGIGPFKSMIEHLYKEEVKIPLFLVFGNRKEPDILYNQQWKQLNEQEPNFHYFPVLSQSKWAGLKGYVHPVYEEIALKNPNLLFYVCGWNKMCVEARRNLKSLGFNRRQYKFEQYD